MAPRPWYDDERREMTTATTTPMRVLGLSGSVRRDSHNRKLLQAAAGVLPEGIELIELERALRAPDLRRGPRGRIARAGRRLPRGAGAGGRGARRDARVQRVGPGRAQERARLGEPPVPRQRAAGQAGRRGRRQHRPFRRRVGTGRGAQDPRRDGRPRARRRVPRSAWPTPRSATTGGSPTRTSPPGWRRSSRPWRPRCPHRHPSRSRRSGRVHGASARTVTVTGSHSSASTRTSISPAPVGRTMASARPS